MIDKLTILFAGLAVLAGALLAWQHGGATVSASLMEALHLLLEMLPQVIIGLAIAALIAVLVPKEFAARWLGERSGLLGIVLATGIGAVMPGGPYASFPLAYALAAVGADIGCLIAFLTAWAALGLQRLLVYEVPFMGIDFAILRLACSVPLPIVAGLIARYLVRRFPALQPFDKSPS